MSPIDKQSSLVNERIKHVLQLHFWVSNRIMAGGRWRKNILHFLVALEQYAKTEHETFYGSRHAILLWGRVPLWLTCMVKSRTKKGFIILWMQKYYVVIQMAQYWHTAGGVILLIQ